MNHSRLDELERRMKETKNIPKLRNLYGKSMEFINYCGELLGVKKVEHQSAHGFAIIAKIKERTKALEESASLIAFLHGAFAGQLKPSDAKRMEEAHAANLESMK